MTSPGTRLLLTVLGTSRECARYELGGREVDADLAPHALLRLLPDEEKPDRVIALCTSQAAAETWPTLQASLAGLCEATFTEVPEGDTADGMHAFVQHVADTIPRDGDVELMVDITHGYRHFAVLTYLAVLHLVALRGVRVVGAYYGMLRRKPAISPFIDLRPMIELPRWTYAVEALRETGSAAPIAAMLDLGPGGLGNMVAELRRLSEAHLSGLPLEAGRVAAQIYDQRLSFLRRTLRVQHNLPLAHELVSRFEEIIDSFRLLEPVSGDGWKRRVVLSRSELARQARMVDDLLQRGSVAAGLGLMREWTVSWATWRLGEEPWLDRTVRRRAEGLLGAISALTGEPELSSVLTPEQRALGRFWKLISELRNAYHHQGMRRQVVSSDHPDVEQDLSHVCNHWGHVLSSIPEIDLTLPVTRSGRVLVSPLGTRPGVLFNAIRACREAGLGDPERTLVICSDETIRLMREPLDRISYTGEVDQLVMSDPFGDIGEIDELVTKATRTLLGADEVLVNLTGGTTLMGLAAEKLAVEARRLARPVRRFGLIDRRPSEKQVSEPYLPSNAYWLDLNGGGDDADG
jgi:hypothetical protein